MKLSEETKKIQMFIKAHPQISSLKEKEVSDFYLRLIDCIVDHNHLYYIENKPIISDKEYDELFDYLKKIEEHFPQLITSNSPTQSLVGQVHKGFLQAKHKVKLASLENSYNAQDLREWNERILKLVKKDELQKGQIYYRVEPKFDGLSVELIYTHGKFIQAITRGDGWVGEDITENVKTIKNIPKQLKYHDQLSMLESFAVRGEIVMPKSVRKELNKEREEMGEVPFANTRNAASGSIKLLDSREVARRKLLCFVYDVLWTEPVGIELDLKTLGFPIFDWVETGKTIDEVIQLCENENIKKMLENQDIDFDGLVIKVEDKFLRESIGSTDHHPRWAIAYKFPAQLVATQVVSVDFQVGRTGIITPVAHLQAVELAGVIVKRVSLHNFDFIKSKDIHLFDRVWLQRSGEVIPYLVGVIKERRDLHKIKKISPPSVCPSCQELLAHKDIHYFCKNPHCPAQIKQKILHFVSKNCMNIEGIGESTVDLLVEKGILKDIADIYTLTKNSVQIQLRSFPGFADKKVAELVKQIEQSKHNPVWRLIHGLGIGGIGKKMAQDLFYAMLDNGYHIKTANDLEKIMTTKEFLSQVYGIGEKTIANIFDFFAHHRFLLTKLESFGVNFDISKYHEMNFSTNDVLGTFSITGTFPVKREILVKEMQKNGYFFHDNPTKTTDFVLVGESPGNKKYKAEQLGLKIYEGWNQILEKFPFLKAIVSEISHTPKVQSLF